MLIIIEIGLEIDSADMEINEDDVKGVPWNGAVWPGFHTWLVFISIPHEYNFLFNIMLYCVVDVLDIIAIGLEIGLVLIEIHWVEVWFSAIKGLFIRELLLISLTNVNFWTTEAIVMKLISFVLSDMLINNLQSDLKLVQGIWRYTIWKFPLYLPLRCASFIRRCLT